MTRWRALSIAAVLSLLGALGYSSLSGTEFAEKAGPGRYRDGRGRFGREAANAEEPSAPSSPLLTGLVRYYKLSGDGVDVHGGVNGTISGPSVTWETGKVSALAMNLSASGSNHFSAAPFIAGDFSCSFWLFRTGFWSSNGVVVGNMTNASAVADWSLLSVASTNINWNQTSGAVFSTSIGLNVTWFHVVLTRSGTAAKIYRDGSLAASGTVTTTGTPDQFNIGSRPDGAVTTPARIQDVGLWNRELTAAEVQQLYSSGNGKAYPFN